MKFLLVTPLQRNGFDNGTGIASTITGAQSTGSVQVDDVALTATVTFAAIEDVAGGLPFNRIQKIITVPITANTTYAQTLAAFKAALSAAYNNIAFQ